MKICFKCDIEKPITEYYKHPKTADGHLNKCKDCTKKDVDKRDKELRKNPEYIEKEKQRAREKYYRLEYRGKNKPTYEQSRARQLKYREMYPEKYKAKSKTSKMKAKIKGNHLHHWSYNEEHFKDVIELSVAGHNQVHRFTIYDQERKMYRVASDGLLLDTRLKCVNYYEALGVKIF